VTGLFARLFRRRIQAELEAVTGVLETVTEEREVLRHRLLDAERLVEHGRKVEAVLVARETSDRRFDGAQIVVATIDVVDEAGAAPRRVVYDHIFGPATARRWRPGGPVDVWVDPDDPENIHVGR
jgi:hypothetical protein